MRVHIVATLATQSGVGQLDERHLYRFTDCVLNSGRANSWMASLFHELPVVGV